ncbi:putative spermidine/putrescine transport system permease protein [Rhodoligotrophos appendicifer]|uniref:ABC transporter permease n=1 Tax=Rhodoligotrophos appendicifer TaxID=987056 RepID=UPI00117CE2F2|nr:ABC transporter permease [Rhodoligotrophos appendicifer]
MQLSRKWVLALLCAPVTFLLAFFIVPFILIVIQSFQTQDGAWAADNYAKIFGEGYYWATLFDTFRLSLWVTVCCFIIGYPLAYYIVRRIESRWVRRLMYIVIITPLFTSNIVRAFGWIVLLGRKGLINDTLVGAGIIDRPIALLYGQFSIILGLVYIMLPFMVLTIASVLQNIDKSLEDAARDLGCNAWTAFLKVTFPLSLPGVVAGSLIIFTLTVSAYVTPSILSGGRELVMSMLIFQQYGAILNFELGAALSVVLLVTTLILVVFYMLVLDRGSKPSAARG